MKIFFEYTSAKQQILWVVSLGWSPLTFVWPGVPKQRKTTAPSSRSQRHLMVFCINQIVPGFVVYYLNNRIFVSHPNLIITMKPVFLAYHIHAIITRSWLQTSLEYLPYIRTEFGVINIQATVYNGVSTVIVFWESAIGRIFFKMNGRENSNFQNLIVIVQNNPYMLLNLKQLYQQLIYEWV